MNTILKFMSADHDKLDGLFEEFKKQQSNDLAQAKSFFHEFKIKIQRHIVWEEDVLFPIFEEKTGMHGGGPTAVMRMEHRQIKDFLEEIHTKVLAGELEGIDKAENGLLEVLRSHNQKEETILYPSIDDLLTDQEREKAFSDMNDIPPE